MLEDAHSCPIGIKRNHPTLSIATTTLLEAFQASARNGQEPDQTGFRSFESRREL